MTQETLNSNALQAAHSASRQNSEAKSQSENSFFWNPENTMEFLKDPRIVQRMLQILTDQPDLILDEIETDKKVQLNQESEIFKLYASSKNKNELFNLELVGRDTDDLPTSTRKAEKHKSMLKNMAVYGQEKNRLHDYLDNDLPETYTLYLLENDLWKDGLPTHTIGYRLREAPSIILDGSDHLVFFNSEYENLDSDLGKLMHDLQSASSEQMLLPEMKDKARKIEEKFQKVKRISVQK